MKKAFGIITALAVLGTLVFMAGELPASGFEAGGSQQTSVCDVRS